MVTGQYVNPKAGQVTFRDYAERWRAIQVQRPSSRAHVETMLRRHAYPALGDRRLSSVMPSEIQAWVKGLELAPATVGVLHGGGGGGGGGGKGMGRQDEGRTGPQGVDAGRHGSPGGVTLGNRYGGWEGGGGGGLWWRGRGEREDSSGASRSRQRGRDAGHLQPSCGLILTTGRGTRSTPCSDLLRTHCGPRRCRTGKV